MRKSNFKGIIEKASRNYNAAIKCDFEIRFEDVVCTKPNHPLERWKSNWHPDAFPQLTHKVHLSNEYFKLLSATYGEPLLNLSEKVKDQNVRRRMLEKFRVAMPRSLSGFYQEEIAARGK